MGKPTEFEPWDTEQSIRSGQKKHKTQEDLQQEKDQDKQGQQ